MAASLKRGRFARVFSMIPRIRSSRVLDNDPLLREAAVVVIRRAGALRGDHARADRVLGRAGLAEYLAAPRLDHALEDLAGLAGLRVRDAHPGHGEPPLGV